MKKIFRWFISLNPIKIGLLLMLVPFVAAFLEIIIVFTSIFLDTKLNIALFKLSISFVQTIFLIWIWTVSVIINREKLKEGSSLFKKVFIFYLIYVIIDFVINLGIGIEKAGGYVDNDIIALISIAVSIYYLLLFASFIYLVFYTGKIVHLLTLEQPNKYSNRFSYFLLMFIFPLGIPILQSKIQQYLKDNNLFGFRHTKRKQRKPVQPKKVEQKPEPEIKKEEPKIDKEDPRRFMPK